MKRYRFVQNVQCEFFPCHGGIALHEFNCLFCYCPLYALGQECGGCPRYRPNGVKDCSHCPLPHDSQGFEFVQARIGQVVEMVKKDPQDV